jgi:DsbC/DsbD-like thiol-disulfide interchange protein
MVTSMLRQCVPAAAQRPVLTAATPIMPFTRLFTKIFIAMPASPASVPASIFPASLAAGMFLALAASCLASSSNALAADASSWNEDTHSAVRLVAGDQPSGGALRAGVELRLSDGWKTYWRYPGDSGVPPEFDFSKSENVKSVSILWPAPHRFTYDGGASIGYKGDVIFPVHVVPDDPARPATLRLTIAYAVCEKLCVPSHGETALVLASAPSSSAPSAQEQRSSSAQEQRLAAAEAQTPKPAGLGDATGTAPLGVAAVWREPGQQAGQRLPRIVVDVVAPDTAPLDLFAEGPTADWALPLPEPVPGAPPGHRRFAFDLDGMPPGVDGTGAPLRLTLVSGENAVEVTAVPK